MSEEIESETNNVDQNIVESVSEVTKLEESQFYSTLQHRNCMWERNISSSFTGSSLNELETVLQEHDLISDKKENLISKFSIECGEIFTPDYAENSSNLFNSFSSPDSDLSASHRQPLAKNDIPSLFVHDNYLKKHAFQISDNIEKSENSIKQKLESSKNFQAFKSQSFSRAEFTYSSNNIVCSEPYNAEQSKLASSFSQFQESRFSSSNQTNSEPSLSSRLEHFSLKRMLANSFECYDQKNLYKFNSDHVISACFQNYDSLSESDDEEEDLGQKIVFDQRNCIEYNLQNSPVNTDKIASISITERDGKHSIQKIASEILITERTYVGILHLLDQVFAFRIDQENRVHPMFPQEIVSQMFTNLKSLYKLHHDFLLPQLEERMKCWDEKERIGDIMKNFAPFLKMYAEYVRNYDNAVNLINTWSQKQPHFQQLLDELHALEECKQLTLNHHMLTPVQRVPRYQLLLKDYLKKLPEDNPDRSDTEKALELVSIAANHANDTMKKIDKFKKLLEIQELISGCLDLVSPSRELLKEGKIIKISARSGDHQERYIFLFNDLLLLCSHRLLPNKVVSYPFFRVRAQLDMDNLVVEEGDNLATANTFYIHTIGRLIELYTPTYKEKVEWMTVISQAVEVLTEKKKSLKVGNNSAKLQDNLELGTRAPNFIKLELVTHCMCCDNTFSTFTFRRKHHCHACGIVACNKCLNSKVQLSYDGGKPGRVCNKCHDILVKDVGKKEILNDQKIRVGSPQRQKGVLDVNPKDPSIICGYLQLKAHSHFWVQRWFALHEDFVLYSFNSHLDETALTSMPLPGYTIGVPEKSDNTDGRENVFTLFHKKKVYFFQTTDEAELQKWVVALDKASRAESFS